MNVEVSWFCAIAQKKIIVPYQNGIASLARIGHLGSYDSLFLTFCGACCLRLRGFTATLYACNERPDGDRAGTL